MKAREKAARDAQVVADRHRGMTWPAIEAKHGLSARHARVSARHRKVETATTLFLLVRELGAVPRHLGNIALGLELVVALRTFADLP